MVCTLQPNLDQLEWHDDERLCRASRSTSKDGQALVHLRHAEEIPVDLAPLIIGSELGCTFGRFHEDGRRDTAIQAGEAVHQYQSTGVQPDSAISHTHPSFLIIFWKQSTMLVYRSTPGISTLDWICLREHVNPCMSQLKSWCSYTRVLTTSSGYMTKISLTPATAPAANW